MLVLNNDLPEYLRQPPTHLSEARREFFRHVVSTAPYDAPARALLIRFCEVWDELITVREALQSGGPMFTDKHGQPRIHPLKKHEVSLTNEYGKLFRLLGWDQAPPDGQIPLFERRR
jgi:phage terminase small subunit